MVKKLVAYISSAAVLYLTTFLVFTNVVNLNAADLSTDTCPGAGCYTYSADGQVSLAVQVTGTFTGTLTFSTSVDGVNFVTSQVTPVGALATPVSTATAGGIWTLELKGIKNFRVAFTAYTDGTAVVTVRALNK